MKTLYFAIPGDLTLPTGGYAYARRVMAEWPALGIEPCVINLADRFPQPAPEDLDAAFAAFAATPAGATILIDGLAGGALPADRLARIDRRRVALVHHPLAYETGLPPDVAARLQASEAAMLAVCDHVIASSTTTAETLVADFAVPADRLSVAEPGTDPTPFARGSGGGTLALLAVGAVVPRKGYDVLIDAMARLLVRGVAVTLTVAGALDRVPDHATTLAAAAAALPAGVVRFAGAIDDAALDRTFDAADLFVVASHYEGFGMGLTEAVSRGLPIVSTTGGALARTFPKGCGLQVPPGDAEALADAIAVLATDPARRAAAAAASRAAASRLTRWPDTARRIAEAIRLLPEHAR